jgi:EcsC protein family
MVDERLVALGERLIDQVIEFGVNGGGPLSGAAQIADEHLIATGGDRDAAVRTLVAAHVRLAALSGFVTGLGGVVTLPVAVPAATAGLYVLATRMSAGIAHLRGYDIGTAEVRSAVLVSLLGSAGASVLRRAGVEVGRRSAAVALERVSATLLIEMNKRIGYTLVAKAGEKGLLGLGKLVPFVGGPIGATVDGLSCRTIATYAKHTFPPKMSVGHPVVDGEIVP